VFKSLYFLYKSFFKNSSKNYYTKKSHISIVQKILAHENMLNNRHFQGISPDVFDFFE